MKENLKKYLAAIAIASASCLASCQFPVSETPSSVPPTSSPTPDPAPASPSLPQTTPTPTPTPPTTAPPVAVTIYQMDNQCQTLVPQTIQVPQEQSLEATLQELLQPWNDGDFSLVGYRVQVDPQRQQATVDLRLAPNARRRFVSLSSCEQRALFGSLRQTMTHNPQWSIQKVEFTAGGDPIDL